jgi:large subunit ribosomal protein L15
MTNILNQLSDNPGAKRKSKRLGRGIGSGKGKTSARGGKGQTARSGVAINGFEGGQTPIHRRLPKRGFNNPTAVTFEVINLQDLEKAVAAKKIDGAKVTAETLKTAGIIKNNLDGLKLLAKGTLTAKVNIFVDAASEAAIKAVEKAGGKVEVKAKKAKQVKGVKTSKKEKAKKFVKKASK